MENYDLAIIGGGPAGYAAAMRALDYKKRVVLIEKSRLGGTGVANGALSSKTWWEIARETAQFRNHLNRYQMGMPDISYQEVRQEVLGAIKERRAMLESHIERLCASPGGGELHLRLGKATLEDRHTIVVATDQGRERLRADHTILATGSKPRQLPHIHIDEQKILSSDGIEHLSGFPKSMVVLGAGVVGCEYATIFSNFGRTQVNLIDKGDRILPFEDVDVVRAVEANFEKQGVCIHRNARLVRMHAQGDHVAYELLYGNGAQEVFCVEKALVSVGREPNIFGLGLENAGVATNDRGVVNDDTQTTVPNIYAVGDLTADIALANVGELEGRHAVEKIFGNACPPLRYENISTIMFLNPEVAGVGLNETQARGRGISYKVATVDYSCIPRAIAKRNTRGFIKLLATNDRRMGLLGMRMVGPHASSAVQAIALLISMGKGLEELAECVHPHPSMTEGVQECARLLLGKSLFKPEARMGVVSCRACANGVYENILF